MLHSLSLRFALGWLMMFVVMSEAGAAPSALTPSAPTRARFRSELAATVRADHPATGPIVDAIRALATDPLEQLLVVDRATRLLVEYDSDERVYGKRDYHATLDEMIAVRDSRGWTYLRDDCDGRAIFAAHLLAGLGIPWRLETSYWKRHAWVSAQVNGVWYDLLDVQPSDPELQGWSYRAIGRRLTRQSRPPPDFAWRRAWRERTDGDIAVGIRLGVLESNSRTGASQERRAVNWARRSNSTEQPTEGVANLAASGKRYMGAATP